MRTGAWKKGIISSITLGTLWLLCCGIGAASVWRWSLDPTGRGSLPSGWKIEATGQADPQAQWQIAEEASAPLGPLVLRLQQTRHSEPGVFNLCWTDQVSFKEGEIAVFLKADSGSTDQGGGPIWRVTDRNNYFIARYNPLEENVSVYYVEQGRRVMLGYSGRLRLPDGWHLLKVIHRQGRIQVLLDGHLRLMVNDSGHFPNAGGVGLWTKADAATSFAEFTLVP